MPRSVAIYRRERIAKEVLAAWGQVKSLSDPLDVRIDEDATNSATDCLHNHPIAGYDLFLLEAMNQNSVFQIITDDGDFAAISGIQVFTSNWNVLTAARTQGKIIRR